jgi:hypothetical protein
VKCPRCQGDFAMSDRQIQLASAANERRLMTEAIGVDAHQILVELQVVGYKADTIALLELAPALGIAWADGWISPQEREVILRIGARNGVTAGNLVYAHLNCWLDSPPCDRLFDASIRAIRAMLDTLQPDVRDAIRRKLVADYTAVAAASVGSVFGSAIGNDERVALNIVVAALEDPGQFSVKSGTR